MLAGAILLLGTGCLGSDELEAQRTRLEREHQERMADLERLEARLVLSMGTIRMWEELGRRHGEVSEIACENAALHAEEMVTLSRRIFVRTADTRLADATAGRRASSSN